MKPKTPEGSYLDRFDTEYSKEQWHFLELFWRISAIVQSTLPYISKRLDGVELDKIELENFPKELNPIENLQDPENTLIRLAPDKVAELVYLINLVIFQLEKLLASKKSEEHERLLLILLGEDNPDFPSLRLQRKAVNSFRIIAIKIVEIFMGKEETQKLVISSLQRVMLDTGVFDQQYRALTMLREFQYKIRDGFDPYKVYRVLFGLSTFSEVLDINNQVITFYIKEAKL